MSDELPETTKRRCVVSIDLFELYPTNDFNYRRVLKIG